MFQNYNGDNRGVQESFSNEVLGYYTKDAIRWARKYQLDLEWLPDANGEDTDW